MLLHRINTSGFTSIDISIKQFWDTFRTEIIVNDKASLNDEDLKGKSNRQWKTMRYYYFLYLLVLISWEMKTQVKNWSYYVEKYNLTEIKKCLHCYGINYDKGLQAFGLPLTDCEEGIECLENQNSFEVEPEEINNEEPENINLLELLSNPNYCINYLQTNCN